MYPSNHRERARNALSGHWGTAILVSFIAGLLGGTSSSGTANLNLSVNYGNFNQMIDASPSSGMIGIIFGILGVFLVVFLIMSIVYLVIGGAISLGSAQYHLNLIDGKESSFSDLFSHFSRLGPALVMNLLSSLFIILWMFLLIIPGIIAAFSYSMAPYIMAEDPNCGGYEALRRSKQLMKGHKMDLFLLELSFIGWSILCVFTLGIGTLWLTPYINTSIASFYRDISKTQAQAQTQTQPRYNTTVEF